MIIDKEKLEKPDDTWAIVELLGHCTLAGRLTEEEKFGSKLGRLDIPTTEPCSCANAPDRLADLKAVPCSKCNGSGIVTTWQTKYFGGASAYRISIVTEAVARHAVKHTAPAPVSPWDFPKAALPAPAKVQVETYEDEDGEETEDRGF